MSRLLLLWLLETTSSNGDRDRVCVCVYVCEWRASLRLRPSTLVLQTSPSGRRRVHRSSPNSLAAAAAARAKARLNSLNTAYDKNESDCKV